ncbi:MAG: winged helix-turn-helix domain-containing protein [Steroidobacteraceae bacterium]
MNSGPATVTPLNAGRYQIEDLQIDTRVRQVTRDGVELGITGLTFDLLWALVRVAPHLVSFDALMEQVWPGLVVGPETVTQRVKLLRQALGGPGREPALCPRRAWTRLSDACGSARARRGAWP